MPTPSRSDGDTLIKLAVILPLPVVANTRDAVPPTPTVLAKVNSPDSVVGDVGASSAPLHPNASVAMTMGNQSGDFMDV